ncbi:translocation/assembly module TamB domain-containing protein [Colwellia echini]|nr:translocation/assembly module TamB domain-containing protein [Colwellia echini]
MSIITGLLCFFAVLLSTPWGAEVTIFVVNKVAPIHIEYKSGALLRGLRLSELSVNNEQTSAKLSNIHLQLHLRCLWKKQLCVDELSIGELNVVIKESGSTTPEPTTGDIILPSLPELPFTLQVKRFSLARLNIENRSFSLALNDFSTALFMSDVAIRIEQATLDKLHYKILEVSSSATSNSKVVKTTQGVNNTQVNGTSSSKTSNLDWPLATLPKVTIPFSLSIQPFTLNSLIVTEVFKDSEYKTLVALNNTRARLTWFRSKLSIKKLSSTSVTVNNDALIDDISLSGDVDLSIPYRLDLTLINSFKNSVALPQLNDTSQTLTLNGDLANLTIVATGEGALTFSTKGDIALTDPNLPYKIDAEVSQFILPTELTEQLPISITPSVFALQSEGDINQQMVNFKSEFSGLGYENVALELVATHQESNIKIQTLHLQDLHAANDLMLTGALDVGQEFAWDINLNTTGFTLPDINPNIAGRIQGNLNSQGFWHDEKWAVTVSNSIIKGELNKRPLNIKANIDMNHNGSVGQSDLLIEYENIALTLTGYSDEEWHINGSATIGNTALWLDDISSQLSSKINVSGPIQQPKINLQGTLTDFVVANVASDKINIDAQYSPLNNHLHEIKVTSAQVDVDEHTINSVQVSSVGDLIKQQVALAWQGDSSIDLIIDSVYSTAKSQWQVHTSNTAFTFDDINFKTNKPLQLTYKELSQALVINKHCWLVEASQLCLTKDSELSAEQGKVPLTIDVETGLLNAFMPDNTFIKSTINGQIAIDWQQGNLPSAIADLNISEGDFQLSSAGELHPLLAWQKGHVNFKLRNNTVDGKVSFTRADGVEVVNASTRILLANADTSSQSKVKQNEVKQTKANQSKLNSQVEKQAEPQRTDNNVVASQIIIKDFNLLPLHVFVPELGALEGLVNSNISIKGDLLSPEINGDLTLTEGKTNLSGDLNGIEDIQLAINFSGQQAVINGGVNINEKPATITGNADWKTEFQANVNFDGESLHLSVPPDLTLTLSPHLSAQLKTTSLNLTGSVEVVEGKLSVDKLPQGSVSLSKDVVMVGDKGESESEKKPFEISTDIRVLIKDVFKVEGQGFIGRLGGELQVSQLAGQPLQLFGGLRIPEGRYRAYGQDLSITKGAISFNGPVNNPYVSIQATRSIEKEDVTVGVDATGLANNLSIKLFSKPTMQQSEILSYLVRGRALDAEASTGSAAIGMALGTAVTNYSGVLTQLEKLPLINRIEIDGDDEQASIAGYLGDQIYIKYGVGVVEPINELTVRFYILSRLWLETVTSLESSASIYYSFDIK